MSDCRLCSIPNCNKPHLARGWCQAHYRRWQRHGDLMEDKPLETPPGEAQTCSIPNCGKPHYARGWCDPHYRRWRDHGDPLGGLTYDDSAQRYFREVVMAYDGDECRAWPLAKDPQGYGRFGGKHVHRRVCEEANGPAPTPKHEAAHSCGGGHLACCTKRHLSWKTPKENQADRIIHGTSSSVRARNIRRTHIQEHPNAS